MRLVETYRSHFDRFAWGEAAVARLIVEVLLFVDGKLEKV